MQEKGRIPIITIILVAINVIVYGYVEYHGSSYDAEFMIQMGAAYEPAIVEGHEYYRLITHFFLHFGWDHLVNNMISLLVLGYALESVLRPLRFVILYFLSGILAGLASIVYNVIIGNEYVVSAGASGAIYGLMGALLVLLILGNRGRRSTQIPRYLLFIGLSLYSGMQDTSIDNAAHIGGFVTGFLLCLIMSRRKHMEVNYEN